MPQRDQESRPHELDPPGPGRQGPGRQGAGRPGTGPHGTPGGPPAPSGALLHVVAVAHGTDSTEGRAMIDRLRAGVDDRLQGEFAGSALRVRVHEAYVDVQEPRLGEVLAGLPAGEWALVLPMLVCDGVHTVHDIADAVAQRPGTEALPPIAAGPTAAVRLAQGLAALVPAGPDSIGADSTAADPGGAAPGLPATVGWCPAPEPPAVVLAVAGTRRPEGQAQAQRLAELVSAELGSRVEAAFCSAAEPRIGDAVARHRDAGRDVVVLSVLLGEGYFQDRLRAAGAQYVSPPLLSPAASSAAMLTECLAETVLEGVRESRS